MSEMSLDWLLGFIEGEGCFSIAVSQSPNARFSFKAQPHFELTIVIDSALKAIQRLLDSYGINLHYREDKRSHYNKNQQDCGRIMLSSIPQCRALAELLTPLKWHTKKHSDFLKWKQCIELLESEASHNKDKFMELLQIRDTMNYGKGGKRKYSISFFKEYLEQFPNGIIPRYIRNQYGEFSRVDRARNFKKEDLEELYLNQKLPAKLIAEKLNCHKYTVYSYLHRYNIPLRNNYEAYWESVKKLD